MRKRQRTMDIHPNPDPSQQQPPSSVAAPNAVAQQQPGQPQQPVPEDGFIQDNDAVDSAVEDDDEEEKPKTDKKAGRRKIKIEFIQDKSRRHITFSKRKAGIMKKAYELSTLTGTQVLLLVVSETGLVYTFTTAKLQPLVTQPEGKNLIQACLNAPHGTLPSSMPVGPPLGRPAPQMSLTSPGAPNNLPGGLSIGSAGAPPKDEDDDAEDAPDSAHSKAGEKRRRRPSSNANPPNTPPGRGAAANAGQTSPHSSSSSIPPPLSIPQHQQQSSAAGGPPPPPPQSAQISLGASPTSPQQQHQQVPTSPQYASASYGHHPSHQQDHAMYPGHMMPNPAYSYPGPGGSGQPLGGLAAAAAQHGGWGGAPPPQVGQSGHYGRR